MSLQPIEITQVLSCSAGRPRSIQREPTRIAPTRESHRETIALTLEKVEDMNPASLMAGIPWDFETFPEYLASVEKRGTLLNYAAYVGHTALRLFHMGAEAAYERAATDAEVAAMSQSVREAMQAGAVGLATSFAPTHVGIGGKPVCSRIGEFSEFEAMAGTITSTCTSRGR